MGQQEILEKNNQHPSNLQRTNQKCTHETSNDHLSMAKKRAQGSSKFGRQESGPRLEEQGPEEYEHMQDTQRNGTWDRELEQGPTSQIETRTEHQFWIKFDEIAGDMVSEKHKKI